MNKRLDSLDSEYSLLFDDWSNSFRKYCDIGSFSEELVKIVSHDLDDFLAGLLKYIRSKDDWGICYLMLNPLIIEVQKTSLKTDCKYHLGLDNNGLYLECHLRYPQHLKSMDDVFWKNLLSLSEFGNFLFKENLGFSKETIKKYPTLFPGSQGNVYRMLRNYVLAESMWKDSADLGSLYISWDIRKVEIKDIFQKACLAFKYIYQLNYSLWKKEQNSIRSQKI